MADEEHFRLITGFNDIFVTIAAVMLLGALAAMLAAGAIGAALPGNLGRTYAGVSGDHNPIHQDESVARSVGLPGVIAHGMYTLALVGRAVATGEVLVRDHLGHGGGLVSALLAALGGGGVARDRDGQRGHNVDGHGGDDWASATQAIADGTGEKHAGGYAQHVGDYGPLHHTRGGVKLVGDGWEGGKIGVKGERPNHAQRAKKPERGFLHDDCQPIGLFDYSE